LGHSFSCCSFPPVPRGELSKSGIQNLNFTLPNDMLPNDLV
jgi:hypothetical protein